MKTTSRPSTFPTSAPRGKRKAGEGREKAARGRKVDVLAKANARKGTSKISAMIELMRAKRGASIAQLANATGWQHHSVRGAISGMLKKKLGLKVISERVNGVRAYRIAT